MSTETYAVSQFTPSNFGPNTNVEQIESCFADIERQAGLRKVLWERMEVSTTVDTIEVRSILEPTEEIRTSWIVFRVPLA